MDIILRIFEASWLILLESSIYILFGFFIAGLLKAFLPDNLISKHLGNGKISSIFKASLIGVPIPLCSCGVIPAAAGLKEQGADKGAVSSFMISTPETGVDSIAITYALLDPVMTILRPVAAFFTAITTGMLVHIFDNKDESITEPVVAVCSGGCACKAPKNVKKSVFQRIKEGMVFAFGDLLDDISKWLMIGLILAGMIAVFISPQFIEKYLGDGFFSMVMMLILAAPLYICATSSTPIAAALALKGLSPGAALVFLLAGPATNIATITVVSKILGKKTAVIYLVAIIISSLALGMLVNYLYAALGLNIADWVQMSDNDGHGVVAVLSAIVLLILVMKPIFPKIIQIGIQKT